MLQVLNAGSTELSCPRGDQGILINCWNKSSPLIKELERTVNFAERKCGDLMQELHFYKEYYEKWANSEQVSHVSCPKKKIKKFCKQFPEQYPDFNESSENELEKANQYLFKRIKSKINEMSNEITLANRKIHSRSETYSAPEKNDPPPNTLPEESSQEPSDSSCLTFANKASKSEPTMTSSATPEADGEERKVTRRESSKSIPARSKASRYAKKESRASKTRCSNLQRFKIRSKSLPQGVKRRFGFGGFFEVYEPDSLKSRSRSRTSLRVDISRSNKSWKSRTRLAEGRKLTPNSSRHGVTKSKSDVKQCSRAKCESEAKKSESTQRTNTGSQKAVAKVVNTCTALVPSGGNKGELTVSDNLRNLIAKPNSLLPFLRHPIPFIPCSSTSRSFNLGLNVQQVLSLIKRKRHSVTLQAVVRNGMQAARSVTEPAVDTLFISQTTTSHSHVSSVICPAREGSEDSFSIITNNRSKCSILKQVQTMRSQVMQEDKVALPGCSPPGGGSPTEGFKPERPEDVWVVEQPDAASKEVRNSRSRCTCFPSKHCVDYNKVLRQYTTWRLAPDTPSCLGALPPGEALAFPRPDSAGRTELTKVYNDLLNLTRKYSVLQAQISQNCVDDCEANAELDAMEMELALKEVEFKDILNFYNQLIILKEKLKSLRTQVGQSQSGGQQPGCQRPRKSPLRPTPSMALAKVLKKIQGLQDKIKLMDAP